MSLYDGEYQIKSAAFDKPFIGRSSREDRSLRPKPVFALAHQQAPPRPWSIKRYIGGPGYKLDASGSPTAPIDNKLFAILLEEPRPEEWVVTPVEKYGPLAFIVHTLDRRAGWVVPPVESDQDVQVEVKPLTDFSPDDAPANEVFIFQPLLQD